MTASCGHVPLSTDAARQVIADQIAQLTKAREALPADSAVGHWLDDCITYATNALALLDSGTSVPLLLGALSRRVAETTASAGSASVVAALAGPVAADLWLALGGHVEVVEVTQ